MATILIVDDDPECRRPLSTLLGHEGYRILQAGEGLEGLQRLRQEKVDLILLDMVMPGVDGIAMLQAVRKDPRFAKIPVILVTAYHDRRKLARAMALGVQEYLFKGEVPFCRILELIKKHLGEFHIPRRRGRKPKIPRPIPAVQPAGAGVGTGVFGINGGAPQRWEHLQLDFLKDEEDHSDDDDDDDWG
jgi:CheY-like chemotaxis protein